MGHHTPQNPKHQKGGPYHRAVQREANIQVGLVDLEQWLQDLISQGLASDAVQSYSFWDEIAARMVDAQAPGLARRLRDCAGLPHSGQDWPERLLAALGKIHLLAKGYQRIETLSPSLQAELRVQVGWTQKKSDLLASVEETSGPKGANSASVTSVIDEWHVLGIRILEEEKLWSQRIWLWGQKSDRPALLLNFAYGKPDFESDVPSMAMPHLGQMAPSPDVRLVPGIIFPAELVFYPSAYPLRAIVRQMTGMVKPLFSLDYGLTVPEAIAHYGRALARNPWLDRMPLVLSTVLPVYLDSGWYVTDVPAPSSVKNKIANENISLPSMPIHPNFASSWELLALSGGNPVAIAAEWDGIYLWPLSASVDSRLVLF